VLNFTPVGLRISEISRGKKKTRNLEQSPTWVRPTSYVRLGEIRRKGKISPASKSRGPNSNVLAYD